MALSLANTTSQTPSSIEAEKIERKQFWQRISRWLGRDDPSCPQQKQDPEVVKPGFGRRLSRKVVPGLPRPATFRRQNSERRERLTPVEPSSVGRRTASTSTRRALSARPPSPRPIAFPKLSAPAICNVDHGESQACHNSHRTGVPQPSDLAQIPRPAPPPSPPPDIEPISNPEPATSDTSYDDLMDDTIKAELEEKWILNLSMHFRDRSPREKFFVTYAETPTRWRRVTVSCDYRNTPPDSLERDLQALQYQRDKSARIYEAIRVSLPDIQFYETVTNLKLETSQDDRLHVHVTEDTNEIIPYPSLTAVQHLSLRRFTEREVHFEAHMSGFVYRVNVGGQVWIKKEIPGPDSVEEFLYEVNALHALIGSQHVIQFQGIVVDEQKDVIKGLLISFAEQGSLVDALFDLKDRLPWERRETWAKQIIKGLSEIHEAGFVQGDFTLSNIVIDEKNNAQIIDINRRGCPVGWEPPEIYRLVKSGQRISMYIGVKSDLFQLGMVLWALAEKEDEPERQPRPLSLLDTKKDVPLYFRDIVNKCLSDNPKDRLAAKDLLPLFPGCTTELGALAFRARNGRHSLSVPSETRYIDPAQAVEREDLDLRPLNPVEGEFSSDSHTCVDRPSSPDPPHGRPDSCIVSRRGRQPAAYAPHLAGFTFGQRSRDVSRGRSRSTHEELEPQIVAVSPTGEHRWDEFEVDGTPYIIQKDSLDFEDDDNEETVQRRRERQVRMTAAGDGRVAEALRHTLSYRHVDSGLADMDLEGVGGHEVLKDYEPGARERAEMQLEDSEDRQDEGIPEAER